MFPVKARNIQKTFISNHPVPDLRRNLPVSEKNKSNRFPPMMTFLRRTEVKDSILATMVKDSFAERTIDEMVIKVMALLTVSDFLGQFSFDGWFWFKG